LPKRISTTCEALLYRLASAPETKKPQKARAMPTPATVATSAPAAIALLRASMDPPLTMGNSPDYTRIPTDTVYFRAPKKAAPCSRCHQFTCNLRVEVSSLLPAVAAQKNVRQKKANSSKGALSHEQGTGLGWHAQGRLPVDVGREAREVGGLRPAFYGLGNLSHEGIAG